MRKKSRLPPGPPALPFIGNVHQVFSIGCSSWTKSCLVFSYLHNIVWPWTNFYQLGTCPYVAHSEMANKYIWYKIPTFQLLIERLQWVGLLMWWYRIQVRWYPLSVIVRPPCHSTQLIECNRRVPCCISGQLHSQVLRGFEKERYTDGWMCVCIGTAFDLVPLSL